MQLTTHRVFEPSDGSKYTIIDPDFMVVLVDVDMPPGMIRSGKEQYVSFDFTSHRFRIGEQGGVGERRTRKGKKLKDKSENF